MNCMSNITSVKIWSAVLILFFLLVWTYVSQRSNNTWMLLGDFPEAHASLASAEALPAGTQIVVDPHEEWISFGDRPDDVVLLPKFWDIKLDPVPDAYTVEVTFEYDPEVYAALGGVNEVVGVFSYDRKEKAWIPLNSEMSTTRPVVRFETSYLDRFALGFYKEAKE